MKSLLTIVGAFTLAVFNPSARGQTADELVLRGKNYLVLSNFVAAQTSFSNALVLNPQHASARCLRGLTRLALIPAHPAVSNLLTRAGFPAQGRSLFDWTARLPSSTNGVLFPANPVNAAEYVAALRSTVLSIIQNAAADFGAITSGDFLLPLSATESHLDDVLVDFGDVQVLRALLAFSQYFIYLSSAHNWSAQLDGLRRLQDQGLLTLERVLAEHPALLTFANTNDLALARSAFSVAVTHYLNGSAKIRRRVGQGPPRLFNFDWSDLESEAKIRCTLLDLRTSLDHPVLLCEENNLTVSLANHFSGQRSFRSFLPRFAADSVLADTLPDPTFGGALSGRSRAELDQLLSDGLSFATWAQIIDPARQVIDFHVLAGQCYAIEFSTNMTQWREIASLCATSSRYRYTNTMPVRGMAYYRLRDLEEFVRYQGSVVDACTGRPIAGARVREDRQGSNVVADAAGQFAIPTRYRPQFGPVNLSATASGYREGFVMLYDYTRDFSGLTISPIPIAPVPPSNDQFGNRKTLTGLPAFGTNDNCAGTRQTQEPRHSDEYAGIKSIWWTWTAPASDWMDISSISSSSRAGYYQPIVAVYTNGTLATLARVASTIGSSLTFYASAGTTYQIAVAVVDRYTNGGGPVQLLIRSSSASPGFSIVSPLPGSVIDSPASLSIRVELTNVFSLPLIGFSLYGDGQFCRGTLAPPSYSVLLTNLASGDYNLWFETHSILGRSTNVSFRIRPPNDLFGLRRQIGATPMVTLGSTRGATAQVGEPAHDGAGARRSVWWSWTAPTPGPTVLSAYQDEDGPGGTTVLAVYTNSSLATLGRVVRHVSSVQPEVAQVAFVAAAGTAYQIALDTTAYGGADYTLILHRGTRPGVQITSPTNGTLFSTGALTIRASASDTDGTIARVELYANGSLLGVSTNRNYTVTWSDPPLGYITLQAIAVDNAGVRRDSSLVEVRRVPPNDSLANATRLIGTNLSVAGTNLKATLEPGENLWQDLGYSGSASVWWRWTAPFEGKATVSAQFQDYPWYGALLGVFTGNTVTSLTQVATVSRSGLATATFAAKSNIAYRIVVDGAYGNQGRFALGLRLQPTIPLDRAMDASSRVWTTSGHAPWFGQAETTHDGVDAAQNYPLLDAQQSVLQTTVVGPGTVSFWWKVSSEAGADYLSFYVGTTRQTRISGTVNWTRQSFTIPSGTQTLRWNYTKDFSGFSGLDAAWVDQFTFASSPALSPPGRPAPIGPP